MSEKEKKKKPFTQAQNPASYHVHYLQETVSLRQLQTSQMLSDSAVFLCVGFFFGGGGEEIVALKVS